VSQRGVILGAGDGSVLLLGIDDGTVDGIVTTDDIVLDVTEGVTEINKLGNDDRSISFAFNGLVLEEQYGVI